MSCNRNPLISIITITFNSEKTLERTILSVKEQDYDNLEYIVVDGGSMDGTVDIIKKYNTFISKWISEPDNGIANAFNKGIKMASGDLIGLINSDDGLLPGALKAIADNYDETVDVYRSNVLLWDTRTNKKIIEKPTMKIPYAGWRVNISHQGTFISSQAYKKYGLYNENYRFSMDFDLLLRYQNAGAVFVYIDYLTAFFTLEGATFTKYTKERRNETEHLIRSNGGKVKDIVKFRIIKYTKNTIKKFIDLDLLLKIKNK